MEQTTDRNSLITEIQGYNEAHDGAEPTEFQLTLADEIDLAAERRSHGANIKESMPSISGIPIRWDAPKHRLI
jgi:hypothetical protein